MLMPPSRKIFFGDLLQSIQEVNVNKEEQKERQTMVRLVVFQECIKAASIHGGTSRPVEMNRVVRDCNEAWAWISGKEKK